MTNEKKIVLQFILDLSTLNVVLIIYYCITKIKLFHRNSTYNDKVVIKTSSHNIS